MISKDKINRVLIYDVNGRMLLATSSVFFPKDFFKVKGTDFVMLKGSDYPVLHTGEAIDAIFEYGTGTRVKYKTSVDLSTEYQMNFRVSDGEVLEERRRSFKIMVDMDGQSPFFIRGEEMFSFDAPMELHIININLGGVLFSSSSDFEPGDQVMLDFMEGEMQLLMEVLRIQRAKDGSIEGYGCKFIDITAAQEEKLAKFIIDCQVLERERKMAAEARKRR
ncbi:MAG: PilZ domain-containing protein [Oscillospiraceae bacterium]|nr:PilZ domain-containing protein [Oscillospiraceae bacterium]